ncbi:YbaB/EbfC DNA-binding family protein [Amycolatopsis xylanica]|uniref:YbaB/EbfC DNA-binding family protein n=1 Tax=Amycolatopsis xylanica TaxID=589385 RepID=A0A1H3CNV9_9PSEU|nr:YbaB/EbfC family nucleoid-associated protein [Amycolatopsis xylanica]SDX55841.1 YbaB/EbfC DNA-binding family protein [Amycolatopsis xylanica]
MTNGLGEFMRDPDEAQRKMDEWAQGFADKAERYRAAQERTEQIRLTAVNSDGAVRVTVGADGAVRDLQFTHKAKSYALEELSRQILTTMRRAQGDIANRVAEVMTEQLGDEDQQTRALMLDNLRSRFPEQEPEIPPSAPPAPPSAPPALPSAGPAAGPPPRRTTDPIEDDNNPW